MNRNQKLVELRDNIIQSVYEMVTCQPTIIHYFLFDTMIKRFYIVCVFDL